VNLRSSLRLNAFLASLSTGAALVACGGSVSTPSPTGSSPSSKEGAEEGTAASTSLALDTMGTEDFGDAPAAAVGACTIARDGTRTDQADLCAGSGSTRILVTYRDGSTCAGALGVPIGGLTPDGQTKSYLFSSAPPIVQERYCVFAGGPSLASDADAERVVQGLCGSPEVAAVTRDCSGHVASAPAAPAEPAAPAAKRGETRASFTATTTPAGSDDANQPHPCDVCGTVAASALYVSLPPSFVAPVANTPMVVRFSAASVSDLVVYPPALAQSFVVGGVIAPAGTDVTIYPPGAVPDPKPR
jgi:hypothetical protein